ncbi:adenylate cyclase / guanylate cyclase [Methylocaldum marinum]|uniref:Adenylate cyclase / guanylate cyclase n=1 Tax=Methylocaldum marinum TaxID=1432792 RepID=A0A286P3Z7_9GAMM|nr:AAA family ATPase [Methylocaldum marinum]BBA32369.1 adenylate cyclase / guanylate cyclase [Methylocaldum marinum]
MEIGKQLVFGPFRLDADNAVLWRDTETVNLPPKAFELLHYLLLNPGRLLTKDALLDAVWHHRHVSESVLKGSINELRKILADDPKSPTYIETIAKRGYRFIAEVWQLDGQEIRVPAMLPLAVHRFGSGAISTHWVGRRRELAWLKTRFERVKRGERQIVFFTGEAGIGKTTLIDMFLAGVDCPNLGLLRARCVETCGAGEAFMALLEALEAKCRDPGGPQLIDRLHRHAPTWLMQMTSLLTPDDKEKLSQAVLGATGARMLREAAELFETISTEFPLVLIIDDLHWGDFATVDLISLLGRRSTPAQLLVIATYRPVDVTLNQHPIRRIRQELQARGLCAELALSGLGEDEIKEYLALRYPEDRAHEALSSSLYRWTEGHPFFMVNLVDHLVGLGRLSSGVYDQSANLVIPDSLLEMIDAQIDRLSSSERRLLEIASVFGTEWSAALLAAVSGEDLATVELCCDELSRRGQMLDSCGADEWPDGVVAGRYCFRHSLYSEILYRRLAPGRRMQLHRSTGEWLENSYGGKAQKIAAELANHFELGRQSSKAISYLSLAAENALHRYANREAIHYFSHALSLAESLPKEERDVLAMKLMLKRGVVKRSMDDADGAVQDFVSVREIAAAAGLPLWELNALMEQCRVYYWVDRPRCLALVTQAVERARTLNDEMIEIYIVGSYAGWHNTLKGWSDDYIQDSRRALDLARATQNREMLNSELALHSNFNYARGDYRSAIAVAHEAREIAQHRGDALKYLICEALRIRSLIHLGELGEARRHAANALQMADRNGNVFAINHFTLLMSWIHELAFDYQGALHLCQSAKKKVQDQRISSSEFFGLIRLASAHLGLRQYAKAFENLFKADQLLEACQGLMDWYLRPLFYLGSGEYWLTQDQWENVEEQAGKLCELAALPPDPAYLALGHRLLAEVAIGRNALDTASAEVEQALSFLGKVEAPIAEWQVYATAAKLDSRKGHLQEAETYRCRSAEVLRRLADSMDQADALRQSLLQHPLLNGACE